MVDEREKIPRQLQEKARRRKKKRKEKRAGVWFAVGTFGIVAGHLARRSGRCRFFVDRRIIACRNYLRVFQRVVLGFAERAGGRP